MMVGPFTSISFSSPSRTSRPSRGRPMVPMAGGPSGKQETVAQVSESP